MKPLLAYDIKKKKYIKCGEVDKDSFLRKVRSTHFMRVVGGYGIQEDALTQLAERKVTKIAIYVEDTHTMWYSTLKDWIDYGRSADYGHGKQRFLSLKYMKTVGEQMAPKTVALKETTFQPPLLYV
jgi:hypothetical protein